MGIFCSRSRQCIRMRIKQELVLRSTVKERRLYVSRRDDDGALCTAQIAILIDRSVSSSSVFERFCRAAIAFIFQFRSICGWHRCLQRRIYRYNAPRRLHYVANRGAPLPERRRNFEKLP